MNTSTVNHALTQLARLGGRDLIGDVLAAFRRQVPDRIRDMLEACASGDCAQFSGAAHSLRSSCGQLGASGLAERCRLLEVLGNSGTVTEAEPLVQGLASELDGLIRELEMRMNALDGPAQGRRVIGLVEDNEDTRLILRTMLEPFFEVDECPDGPTALERFRLRAPDAILLDISLPGMDGPAVLVELRRMPGLGTVPVIALTAHAMVGDREWYLSNGFDEYISKPILDDRDLVQVLRKVLEPRHDS